MSSSEIAFLAIGLIIGATVGAAIAEAFRAGPGPRRPIRVTIAPNSVSPRRSTTLSDPAAAAGMAPVPGSPEDGAWPDAPATPAPVTPVRTPAPALLAVPARTPVPSPVGISPAATVAVPVQPGASVPVGPGVPAARPAPVGPAGGSSSTYPLASAASFPTAVGVLDPIAPLTDAERATVAVVDVVDVGPTAAGVAVHPRPPVADTRPSLPPTVVAVLAQRPRAQDHEQTSGEAVGGASAEAPTTDPCDPPRRLVDERCALAAASRDHARRSMDALRETERAYGSLRGLLEQAEKASDPRELTAARDELHRRFRAASDAAPDTDAAEAAAREWLDAINDLNATSRESARFVESGRAELRAALPGIERLSVEAEVAGKSAEAAAAGCQEARESLAACVESEQVRLTAAPGSPVPAEEPHPFDALWPGESDTTRTQPLTPAITATPGAGHALALRIVRGDRVARDRLVAGLAGSDAEETRTWHLRLSALVDAIVARAIEDGYLDLPEDDAFWGLFAFGERREIVGALSALGYRFDGLGGFADGRIPTARDLSLAVGYAGLERMRIRTWPREAELDHLYERATVSADEWLIAQADDLSLGRMVDALGARAGDFADIWNDWGRLRLLLLSAG